MDHIKNFFSAFALIIAAATTVAYGADNGMENNAFAVTKAKVSLTQAIAVAEQHDSGRAVQAEYENSKNGWAYDVEAVSGAEVFDVRVDVVTSTIIFPVENKTDRDDD